MKNKKMTLKLGLLAVAIGCFSLSSTSATLFRLNIDKIESLSEIYLSEKIIPIHFADNGNDFGGFFYFSNGLTEEGEGDDEETEEWSGYYVTIGNTNSVGGIETYECDRQVKGFYYNAERGERLWPLDQDTWASAGIDTTGGFYTLCKKEGYADAIKDCLTAASDPHQEVDAKECKENVRKDERYQGDGNGYYGYIGHTYSGQNMGVIVGVNYTYNPTNNKFIQIVQSGGFSPSFVRINNQYPVGFVYDYNGGIGLVGCKASNGGMRNLVSNYNSKGKEMGELFQAERGDLRYTLGDNAANCSDAVRDPLTLVVIEGVVGMGEMGDDNKFGIVGNQKDLKMQYFSSADINNNTIINYARKKAELLCRGKWNTPSSDSDVVCYNNHSEIPLSQPDGKTWIVKNGNVTIKPFDNSENGYYDIFIDSGNLIIDETDASKFVFDINGFKSGTLTGTFINNVQTAIDARGSYTGNDVAIGSFIKGNFIINGNIKSAGGSGLENKYFIHGKISTRDDFDTLFETFKWRCNYGNATDGTYCPMSIKEEKWENPFEHASLVIIDQNYKSPFFNNDK